MQGNKRFHDAALAIDDLASKCNRVKILAIVSLIGGVASWLDAAWLHTAATLLLLLLVLLLPLIWFVAQRAQAAEEQTPQPSLWVRWYEALADYARNFSSTPAKEKRYLGGRAAFIGGVILLGMVDVFTMLLGWAGGLGWKPLKPDDLNLVSVVAIISILFGGYFWYFVAGRRKRIRAPSMTANKKFAREDVFLSAESVLALAKGRSELDETLRALSRWKPRDYDKERLYSDALFRYLRRTTPNVLVRQEVTIGRKEDGTWGRVDLLVGEYLMIELKRGPGISEADRAVSQVGRYCEGRPDARLVLVVLDGSHQGARAFMERKLRDLRGAGFLFGLWHPQRSS